LVGWWLNVYQIIFGWVCVGSLLQSSLYGVKSSAKDGGFQLGQTRNHKY
jgi:hypothetical protein